MRVEDIAQLAHPGRCQADSSAHVITLIAVCSEYGAKIFESEGVF